MLWVQNCHLAQSWMPQLVKLVEEVEAAAAAAAPGTAAAAAAAVTPASGAATAPKPPAASAATNAAQGFFLEAAPQPEQQQQQLPALHPNFRLWLTSSPVDFFPPVLLHKGVRLFLEPHRGLKPTLLGIYSSLPRGYLSSCDGCGRGPQWRQLVFAGALLHGLLCERRRFGPLGWNVPYEFSEGDLSCALANIQVCSGLQVCVLRIELRHGCVVLQADKLSRSGRVGPLLQRLGLQLIFGSPADRVYH